MNKKSIVLVIFFETIGILVLLLVLVGCGTAIKVTKGGTKLDGIPFYTKAVACKHETIWLEPIYKLTLVGTKNVDRKTVEVFTRTKEISLPDYHSDNFRKLIAAVNNKADQKYITDMFEILPQYKPPAQGSMPETNKLILASNQNEAFVFIDYTDPYYYNAKIPWAGTVNAEITLSNELTLSKATTTVTEQTLKTFLDLLPVKEVLTGAAKAAKGIIAVEPVDVRLTIEPQVYKYTLSILGVKAQKLPCENPGAPLKDPSKGTFFRTLMSADESKKKEDGSNTVKFSGSVDLPKTKP